jgi:predicted MFS family arabinose efflux permease
MVLAAWIIQTWGWKSVFYIVSVPGLVWCLLWWWLGNSRPQMDNRINRQELAYIQAGRPLLTRNHPLRKRRQGAI